MANDSSKLTNPWFEHDENASIDGKILKMFRDFRMLAKKMTVEELESFAALGAYGVFWRLVEFMHGNALAIGDADIIADDLRIDTKYVEMILKDYDLFHEEDGYYISDRIVANLRRRGEKSKKNSEAVNVRWLLYAFNKAYTEFFEEEPVLLASEIEALKKYDKKIPDLKDKFRDIIFTMKCLKFDTDINFKPCANWLLKNNNLARLVNGEFGTLKHKKTEGELKEEQRRKAASEADANTPFELEQQVASCSGKAEALNIIAKYYENSEFVVQRGKALILPMFKSQLMKKFDITDKEVIKKCQK